MSFTARIVKIVSYDEVPLDLMPFVLFKARLEERTPAGTDTVVILQIENIESYYPVFIDGKTILADIENGLARLETKLDEKTKIELNALIKTRASHKVNS